MHANSIASRAIAHLRTLKPGVTNTSQVIADAIDSESGTIAACLAPYVKSGQVAVRKEGRINLYSVGTGKAAKASDADDLEHDPDDKLHQRTVKAKAGDRGETNGHASVFHAGGGTVPHPTTWKGKVATKATPTRKPAKRTAKRAVPNALAVTAVRRQVRREVVPTHPQAHSLGVALFNTGELVIEVAQQPAFRLSREQTGELIDYLMRLDQLATSSLGRAS